MATTTTWIGTAAGARILALLLFAGSGASALAQSGAIYLCVDENGHKELTDSNKKGCKQLDLPATIPAPNARKGASRESAPVATPANFPKVDSAVQKARDADRRSILQDELSAAEKKLEDLKRDYKDGQPDRNGNEKNYSKYQERVSQMRDDIPRTEQDIEALKRELANLK